MLRRLLTTAAAAAAALALAVPTSLAVPAALAVHSGPSADTAPRSAARTYVVRPGDSLTGIAARFGTSLGALARTNRLDPAKPLPIGVTLQLPARWCPGEQLTVQPGDSLWVVAARFGLSRTRLAAANGLSPAALLILGAPLRIPARPGPDEPTGAGEPAPLPAPLPAPTRPAPVPAPTPARTAPASVVAQGPALSGGALAQLRGKLAAAAVDPALAPSLTGVAVIDLRDGSLVYAQNGDTPLAPASTEKVPLLAAALAVLGPNWRPHTDVLATGGVAAGVLSGDIVLKGFGDPRLSVGGLGKLAAKVRALGVTRVAGAVVADESAFDSERIGPGWKAKFLGEESPPLSALVVDGLAGPSGPAATAAVLFAKALSGAGITVTGESKPGVAGPGARVLATISGPPFAELAAAMGTWSDNYIAETTLKQLGLHVSGRGTSAAGAAVVTQRLAALGVPRTGVVIADGSGLSTLDRMTARALATTLAAAARDGAVGPVLEQSFAIGGVTGTLRRRLRGSAAAGIVRAKTGTTDGSSALAGYVGDRFAFAVISNSPGVVDQWAAHALQDRVVETLAESLSPVR